MTNLRNHIRDAMPWAPLPDDLGCYAEPLSNNGLWDLGDGVCIYYSPLTGDGEITLMRGTRTVEITLFYEKAWSVVVTGPSSRVSGRAWRLPVAVIHALGAAHPLHDDLLARVAEVVGHITKR